MPDLVLSIFPGIDMLGRAFEQQGFCVVRGPDLIWGGDIRTFHPPAGVFDGVIGGPPCQAFSALAPLIRHNGYEPRFGNLIPEYERVVAEAQPRWFVMENVRGAPVPDVEGYDRWSELLTDADVGGVQPRVRRISLGFRDGVWAEPLRSPFTLIEWNPQHGNYSSVISMPGLHAREADQRRQAVLGDQRPVPVKIGGSGKLKRSIVGDSRPEAHGTRPDGTGGVLPKNGPVSGIADMLEAQGMPRDYLDDAPFTMEGKRRAIGNGVPIPMGRAIAKAVKLAIRDP